jgi:sortase A
MKNKPKNKTKNKVGAVLSCIGLICIIAALVIWGYNVWDDNRAGQAANDVVWQLNEELSGSDDTSMQGMYEKYPQMEMPKYSVDGDDYIGYLEIPDLELMLPVMSEWSYPNLRTAPCRYSGSAYLNNLVIAAHNYSRHFGNIKNLQVGSCVTLTDMDNNKFVYNVAEIEEVLPTDIDEMKTGDWDLTLFTCNNSGRRRIAVRCVKAE